MEKIRFMAPIAALILTSGAGYSQATTTQAEVIGPSSDPVYSEQIVGANAVVYNCRPDPVMIAGVLSKACRAASGGGTSGNLGGLGGEGAAAGAAALVLVAVVAANEGSTNTTN